MPDKKISDLTSGSAIGGTEELPIVQGSTTVKTTINAIKTFFDTIYTTTSAVTTTLLGYVKKGTLTTNYIPKATASDTIGDSQIFDDGTNVGIGTMSSPLLYVRNDGKVGVNISSPLLTFSVKATANLDGIILQEDASNYYASFQKDGTRGFLALYDGNTSNVIFNSPSYSSCDFINTSYNLAIGLNAASAKVHIYGVDYTSSYALKIDNSSFSPLLYVRNDGLINIGGLTPSQIVETDASKNLVSAAKGTAYNKNFGTTAGTVLEGDKGLLIANNLSDLNNPLTARNNLKIWDLFLTGGDQSTTSNVATNITDLVSPTLTASKRYRIHGVIKVGCNNTGGIRFQITLPSGASMDMSLSGSNTSNTTYINATITSSATLSASVQSFNGLSMLRVDGEISLGVTAGTIQFGFASGTNTQTSTVYQLGTSITIKQLN